MTAKAVILVGGPSKGTRFRPLSMDMPKPLFPLAGRPMIYHHVEACAQVEGLTEIFIVGFFEEQQFLSFIAQSSRKFGISIQYLREDKELGTGGGINHYRKTIMEGDPDHVFVIHCDICANLPLGDMMDFHTRHNGLCTMMGKRVPREEATNYGCFIKDPKTHEAMHYAEKPQTFVSNLINCGVYLFTQEVFTLMTDFVSTKQDTPGDSPRSLLSVTHPVNHVSIERDIFSKLAGKGRLFVFETTSEWCQIKAAGAALRSTEIYLNDWRKSQPQLLAVHKETGPTIIGNVVIHPHAQVHSSAKLGPNVSVGLGARVGAGVRIQNSIVLEGSTIKDHACILNSIIGWNSTIGQWCRIEGTSCADPNGPRIPGPTILGVAVHLDPEKILRNCVVLPHKHLSGSYQDDILL